VVWCRSRWTCLPCAVQSVSERHTCTLPPRRSSAVRDTALVATSRRRSPLVCYLETHLGALDHWLQDWRIAINVPNSAAVPFTKTARRIHRPRLTQFFWEPIEWVETARYLGVTLDTQLTWSAHDNQVGRAKKLGVLDPLRIRRSGLSIRNGVLLCKQLIRLMIEYSCPIWRSAARSHVRKLQALRSWCLNIATNALWQTHENMGIQFFGDHIRN
jgi:hypothetical protein